VRMVPFLLWTMVGQFCARKTGVIFPTRFGIRNAAARKEIGAVFLP